MDSQLVSTAFYTATVTSTFPSVLLSIQEQPVKDSNLIRDTPVTSDDDERSGDWHHKVVN